MTRFSSLAPAALLFLTACASQGGSSLQGQDRLHGGRGAGGFNMAARLVDQGEYEQALPILRCVAGQGNGFEIAQYLAGHSAMRLSDMQTTSVSLRDTLRTEGFERLTSAAQAGWPTAQAELATRLAASEDEGAPVQAAYWAAVYRRNVRDRTFGLDRLDDGVEAEITARVGAARSADIENLAAEFVVQPMTSVAVTPSCAPYLGSPGFGPRQVNRRPANTSSSGQRPAGSGRGTGRPGR